MSKRNDPEQPEMQHPSTKRAKQIDEDLPYDNLRELLSSQNVPKDVGTVLHWFRSKDLRIQDNRALHAASEKAKSANEQLICLYINCDDAFLFHGVSPARLDFIHDNLRIMQEELKKLDIPLVFVDAEKRSTIAKTVIDFVKEHGITHVYANYEYEQDEMARDVQFLEAASKDSDFYVELLHDQTVVEPGTILSGAGKPMKVFTAYHKVWLEEVKRDPGLLDTVPVPSKNVSKKGLEKLFGSNLPTAPKEKQFASNEEKKSIRKMWPAGHEAALGRMRGFLDQIDNYAATRSNPAADSTSRMSAYFSAGVISMRETLSEVKRFNNNSADFTPSGSSAGVTSWVREIVFRELYRQTTLYTPHTSMNLPQNLKFDFVNWESDEEGYKRWEEGTLGVPFIDAGMRQIKHEAYMHNRLRMNVSSYLYCNLLVDYRRGERYFAETLIDWDLSNNTQGWEPSYTVFNPVSQAEKNDPQGDYIRRWVPELRGVVGKEVFDPYNRLSEGEFGKLGYPEPYVDWKETKLRAVERFKRDMKDAVP
ncbi:deoxyribodipyrimidine photo-lyase [Tothia fuscella]|uniref:Deoxyribodipyrimidine photo-lyase n=1 Tax=Tothia fuscella TaxID=1048955 RepID=A0A9P4NF73_9PEZI|nr:deoxyribodipyrimidine photo-lyase [Tothia fuscella]